jgi:hypothetical protein
MVSEYGEILEILNRYTSQAVKAIFATWTSKRDSNGLTKSDSIERLSRILSDADKVANKVAELNDSCRCLLFEAQRTKCITSTELIFAGQTKGLRDAPEALKTLVTQGLLLARPGSYTNNLELNDIVRRGVGSLSVLAHAVSRVDEPTALRESLPTIPDSSIRTIIKPEPARVVGGLIRLTNILSKRDIRTTASGTVNGGSISRLERELELEKRVIPLPLLIAIARAGRIVRDAQGTMRPDANADRLLSDPLATTIRGFFDSFVAESVWPDDWRQSDVEDSYQAFRLGNYRDPDPGALRIARRLVVGIVQRLDTTGWINLEDLSDLAITISPDLLYSPRPDRNDYYYQSWRIAKSDGPHTAYEQAVQREFVRCCVGRTLALFGLVELGQMGETPYAFGRPSKGNTADWSQFRDTEMNPFRTSDDKKLPPWHPTPCHMAFRVTDLGRDVWLGESHKSGRAQASAALTVGADFEIVAPLDETPLELRLKLDVFAQPIPGHPEDRARRYRLEKSSILRALRSGMDVPTIIADLQAHAGHPVPQNVVRTLTDWTKGFGEVTLFLDRDLVEFEEESKQTTFLRVNKHAEPVGTRFALVTKDVWGCPTIDYSLAPSSCLSIDETGVIRVNQSDADLAICETLRQFAEPGDSPDIFRITRESVTESSLLRHQIVDLLQKRVKFAIPESVVVAISGWCGEIEPVRVDTVTLLKIDNRYIVDGLLAHKQVSDCIVGQLAYGLLIVKENRLQQLTQALDSLGIKTSTGIQAATPVRRSVGEFITTYLD